MINPLVQARVIKTSEIIQVYQLSNKDKYCDYADCKTIYDVMELDFQDVKDKWLSHLPKIAVLKI